MENAATEHKAKAHLAGKRAALEEIGNKVATRGTRIAKVKEHLKCSCKGKKDYWLCTSSNCSHYRKQNAPKHPQSLRKDLVR